MKVRFPCYASVYPCNCTAQEAAARITEMAENQKNYFKIMQAFNAASQYMVLCTKTEGLVYHNSFMPIVSIHMHETNENTQVSVLFELKKSVKVFVVLLSVLMILFEMVFFAFYIANQLVTPALLCCPLGLIILCYTLCTCGLYFSSKGVLRILFATLAGEDTKNIPPVQKFKQSKEVLP